MRDSKRDSHFFIWKSRVEKHMQRCLDTDMTLDDLPDEMYRIWFDETDFTPKEVGEFISYKFLNMI